MSVLCAMVGASFQIAAAAQVIRRKVGISAITNAKVSTAQSKFGGGSLVLDANGDTYLATDNTSQGVAYGDDFTFEGWVRFNSLPNQFGMLATGSTRGDYVAVEKVSGTWNLTAAYSIGSDATTQKRNIGFTPSTGVWYHFAIVKEGSTVRHFWDGTLLTVDGGSAGTMTAAKGWNGVRRVGDWANAPNYVINGYMDEVRLSNSVRYTTTFTPSTTPFQNDENTLLLLHMDGTNNSTFFEDDNGVRAPVGMTATGGAIISTSRSKFGGSSWNGSSSSTATMLLPQTPYTFGTSDFTIECFASVELDFGSTGTSIFSMGTSINEANNYRLTVGAQINNFGLRLGSISYESTFIWSLDVFYHLAVVRTNGVVSLYIDGVKDTSIGTNGNIAFSTDLEERYLGIGRITYHGVRAFPGYIDEFRVSNTARYTTNFTPSTTPFVNDANTLLLLHMDGTNGSTVFRDDVGMRGSAADQYTDDAFASFLKLAVPFDDDTDDVAYLIANTGLTVPAVKTQGASSVISPGGAFGGYNNSELNSRAGAALTYVIPGGIPTSASGSYVVEGWFAADSAQTNSNWVLSSAESGGRWLAGLHTGTARGTANENWVGLSNRLWHHCAIVCNAGAKRFYVDGIDKGEFKTPNTGFSTLHVGQFNPSGSNNFIGRMQDLRVYVGTVKGYTGTSTTVANFALPQPIKRYRVANGISAFGDAKVSTAQSQFGGASAVFDGTGDHLELGETSQFAFGAGDFTIECWFRLNALNATQVIWDQRSQLTQTVPSLYVATDNKIKYYTQGNPRISGDTLTTGVWYYVAVVHSGSETKLYVDGTQSGSTYSDPANYTTGPIYIGSISYTTGGGFNGHIDELRVSNTARYTAGFTPQTQPHVNDANTLLLLHMDGTNNSTTFVDDTGVAPDHEY